MPHRSSFTDDPVLQALRLFDADPLRSLISSLAVINERFDSDPTRWHLSVETVASVLAEKQAFLDVAKALAERLYIMRADAFHARLLARVLEASGDKVAAEEHRRLAEALPQDHDL